MAIGNDFFNEPIVIPCTFVRTRVVKRKFSQVDEKVFFFFRRETKGDTDSVSIAATAGATIESVRLSRFCNLLTKEPEGVIGFPDDERPLRERAKEYFASEFWQPAILIVMGQYDQLLYPAELYSGF